MPLQVWLPLNGDLNNQGLSNITASGILTYSDSGKIGKCANVDSGHVLTIPYSSGALYDFSFSFWIKIPTTMSANTYWETMLSFRAINTANSTTVHTISMNFADYHQVKIYDDQYHQHNWRTPTYDVWEHWTIVHHSTTSSSNIKFYINGILNGSYDTSHPLILQNGNIYFGSGVSVGSFALNDIRIYDHCLSLKEIGELSKGLVLHYPLNDQYIENTTNISSQTSKGGWNNSGSALRETNNSDLIKNAPYPTNVYSIKVITAGNCALTFGQTNTSVPSKTLTCSVYCYLSGTQDSNVIYIRSNKTDGNIGNFFYKGSADPRTWPLNKWIRLERTITTNAEATTIYFCTYANSLNNIRAFCGWQIEEKDHATPYTSSSRSQTTVYDCSGYSNNGTKVGTIICDSDTPRYMTSCKMVSSNIGVSTSTGMTTIYSNGGLTTPSEMTITFWLKPIKWNYQDSGLLSTTIASYPTDYTTSAINQYDGVFRFNASDGSSLNISATSLVNDSLWHHYSFVFDGINVKVYKDSALTSLGKSFSSTKTLGSFNKVFIGLSQAGGAWRQTSAYWSDFRIYATALSSEDIKELYQISATIDKGGNVFGYDFIESGKNSVFKEGIVDFDKIIEYNKDRLSEAEKASIFADSIEAYNYYEF